ncbi:MAG: right-handed parallel beta-helix repeat-containing protein [Methanomassiliicoccales archaeon]|nr:right-handed parallel beta-helix repeat-containing protein [Methanomassiliicoccales archaeon]
MAKRAVLYLGVLAFALVLLLFLGAGQASAGYVPVSGDITSSDTWESGNVYNVTGPVTITDGTTLTIENNVTVNFMGTNASLTVDGTLIVQGTEDLPVVFDSNGSYFWGNVTFNEGSVGNLANLNIINATIGINMVDTSDVVTDNVTITDAATTGMMITLNEGDWEIALSDLNIVNASYGIYVQTFNGSLVLDMSDVEITNALCGLYVEVGTLNVSDLRTLDLSIDNCVFNGGYIGVFAEAPYYGNAAVTNSQFLGQMMVSYIFDSLEGEVNVDITDSTFDGSSNDVITAYLEEQIESDYELIGRESDRWNDIASDDNYLYVELPFDFTYDSATYDHVYMYNDGYLYFASGEYIYPVGTSELFYNGMYFYGYSIAEDNSSVIFNWAATVDIDNEASCAFEVELFPDGTVQIHLADMECFNASSTFWGITTSSGPGYDYNLYSLYGDYAWNMDWTSWEFTPYAMSSSIAMMILADNGSMDLAIDNVTVANMYGGALLAYEGNGSMDLAITNSTFEILYGMFGGSIITAYGVNGSMDVVMTDNTFENVWSVAAYIRGYGLNGGTYNFDVSDNMFTKVALGIMTSVEVEAYNDTADQTVNVVANFDNNVMTDSFGLTSFVHVGDMYNNDEGFGNVNWTVNAEQTFTNNVMTQERYDGGWCFGGSFSIPAVIDATLVVKNQEFDDNTELTVNHDVTITGNEIESPVWTYDVIAADTTVENTRGDLTVTNTYDVSGNEIAMLAYYGIDFDIYSSWDNGTAVIGNDIVVDDNTIENLYDNYDDQSTGIYVGLDVGGFTGNYAGLPSDMTLVDVISVSDNNINGTPSGIYAYDNMWQFNTEGAYAADVTMDIDDNVINNTVWGIYAYVGADVWFGNNYWPYWDHNATGTFNLEVSASIDNNTIIVINGFNPSSTHDGAIYWYLDACALVDSNILFSMAMMTVESDWSVSENNITMIDSQFSAICASESFTARKTSTMTVSSDVTVDDNTVNTTTVFNDYDQVPSWVFDLLTNVSLEGEIETDDPVLAYTGDWSISGNTIVGDFETGIILNQDIDCDADMGVLTEDITVDVSENTVGIAIEGGIILDNDYDVNDGFSDLSVDIELMNNTIELISYDPTTLSPLKRDAVGMSVGEMMDKSTSEEGMNMTASILISGNNITGGDSAMEVSTFDGPITAEYNVTMVMIIEDNVISGTDYGIRATGANITITGNVIDAYTAGIYWVSVYGEVSGNTISAFTGIELFQVGEVLVQNNDVTYMDAGVVVDNEMGYSGEVQVLYNTLTWADLDDETLQGYMAGVFIAYAENVTVMGNTITDAFGGVFLAAVTNVTVQNNTISYTNYGIYLTALTPGGILLISNNTIDEVDFEGMMTTGRAIWLSWFGNATIENNVITDAGYGIYVTWFNYDLLVQNNDMTYTIYGVYVQYIITGANIDILGNDLAEVDLVGMPPMSGTAVYVYGQANNVTVADNTVADASYGVYLGGVLTNVTVQNNEIEYVWSGIGIEGDYDFFPGMFEGSVQILNNDLTEFDENTGQGDGWAIWVEDRANVLIDGNVMENADYGVYVEEINNLTISDNEIASSGWGYGIWLYEDVFSASIESNVISGAEYGIYADYCYDVVIGNNTISDSYEYGIYLDYNMDTILWNNEFTGSNSYDVYGYDGGSTIFWYIDDTVTLRGGVYLYHAVVTVLEGGALSFEFCSNQIIGTVNVEEGALLHMNDASLYNYNDGRSMLNVYGTLIAHLSGFYYYSIYLGPTADAELRSSYMYANDVAITIDGCDAVVSDCYIYNSEIGILVQGEGAVATIVSTYIEDCWMGIQVVDADMCGIYDNIIYDNSIGVLAENATGSVHDNILVDNGINVYLIDSDVSVVNNDIGFTDQFEEMAARQLELYERIWFMINDLNNTKNENLDEDVLDEMMYMLEDLSDYWYDGMYEDGVYLATEDAGIWTEGSTVTTSGNTYGLLKWAVYAVDSTVNFADDVTTSEVQIPLIESNVTYYATMYIYVYNGIYAANSTVNVSGSTIEVVNNALELENSSAIIEDAELMGGNLDYLLFDDSVAYNVASNFTGKLIEDTSILYVATYLTIHAEDEGDPAANVTIVITNGKGETVFNGVTDANGEVVALLGQYAYTSSGKDDLMNDYHINATFPSGDDDQQDITLDESYMDATVTGAGETDMGTVLAVVGALVIILLVVAAIVVMRRRK